MIIRASHVIPYRCDSEYAEIVHNYCRRTTRFYIRYHLESRDYTYSGLRVTRDYIIESIVGVSFTFVPPIT